MSRTINGRNLHLVNFFEPYGLAAQTHTLPTPSDIPFLAKYQYDLSPELLREPLRRPPIINIVRYNAVDEATGLAQLVERPVYGGEWRSPAGPRRYHFEGARRFWAEKLGISEDQVDIYAEDPRPLEVQLAEDEKAMVNPRGGRRKQRRASVAKKRATKAELIAMSPSPGSESGASWVEMDARSAVSEGRDATWSPGASSAAGPVRRPAAPRRRQTSDASVSGTSTARRNGGASVMRNSAPASREARRFSPISTPIEIETSSLSPASTSYSPMWSPYSQSSALASTPSFASPSPVFSPNQLAFDINMQQQSHYDMVNYPVDWQATLPVPSYPSSAYPDVACMADPTQYISSPSPKHTVTPPPQVYSPPSHPPPHLQNYDQPLPIDMPIYRYSAVTVEVPLPAMMLPHAEPEPLLNPPVSPAELFALLIGSAEPSPAPTPAPVAPAPVAQAPQHPSSISWLPESMGGVRHPSLAASFPRRSSSSSSDATSRVSTPTARPHSHQKQQPAASSSSQMQIHESPIFTPELAAAPERALPLMDWPSYLPPPFSGYY